MLGMVYKCLEKTRKESTLLRSARVLSKVLATSGDVWSLSKKKKKKTLAKAGMKNMRSVNSNY